MKTLAQGKNPWQDYEKPGNGNNGGAHGRPIIPEPSQMALVGLLLLLILYKSLKPRK